MLIAKKSTVRCCLPRRAQKSALASAINQFAVRHNTVLHRLLPSAHYLVLFGVNATKGEYGSNASASAKLSQLPIPATLTLHATLPIAATLTIHATLPTPVNLIIYSIIYCKQYHYPLTAPFTARDVNHPSLHNP